MTDETIFTILRAFRARAGAHWLLLFDFDGTLVDVVTSPDGAKISDTTHGLLDALIERDDCTVGIVSGREISDLRQRTALGSTAWLAGAHGFEIEGPDGTFVHPAIDDARETFIAIATQVRKELHRFPGVAVERKRAALVLHTLAADAGVGARARERFIEVSQPYMAADKVRLHAGRVAFELLAPANWNKGNAVHWIRSQVVARRGQPVLTLYAGDDVTDEDAFGALDEGDVALVVGDRPSQAPFRVRGPADLQRVLHALVDART
ncbi:MAG: trehalose-phosphatase [Acidobacteria bacterium]|nr:trehalose-phosphatase [Acidobacteriota bacterium]